MTIIIDGADKPATRASLGLTIGTDVLAPNGSAASLTNIPADQITGTIAHSNLGTGGSASTFLRGDGTFAAAGGGAWEVIGSVEANNDATVQVTGLSTAHSIYALGVSNMRCSASGNLYHINFGTSSGIDAGSNYRSFLEFCSAAGTYHMAVESPTIRFAGGAMSGASDATTKTDHTWSAFYYISRRGRHPTIHGTYVSHFNNNDNPVQGGNLWGVYIQNNAFDRIQIKNGSGVLVDGTVTVWGLKNA